MLTRGMTVRYLPGLRDPGEGEELDAQVTLVHNDSAADLEYLYRGKMIRVSALRAPHRRPVGSLGTFTYAEDDGRLAPWLEPGQVKLPENEPDEPAGATDPRVIGARLAAAWGLQESKATPTE